MNESPVASHYIGLQSNLYYANNVIRNFPISSLKVDYSIYRPSPHLLEQAQMTQLTLPNTPPVDIPVVNPIFRDREDVSSSNTWLAFPSTYESSDALFDFKGRFDTRVGHRSQITMFSSYSLACNISDKIIALVTVRGVLLYLSPKACEHLLERESKDLVGSNISEYLHPADNTHVLRALKTASSEESPAVITCRMRKRYSGYNYVNIIARLTKAKGMRSLVLVIKPLYLTDVPLSYFMLESYELPIFMKLSPQLLILYCSKGFLGSMYSNLFGMRLCDILIFTESEEHILNLIKRSLSIQLVCKVDGEVKNIRVLRSNDGKGSTLIAQIFSAFPKNAEQGRSWDYSGTIYDSIYSSPSPFDTEILALTRKNAALKSEILELQTNIALQQT
jgi:hypothetical protein